MKLNLSASLIVRSIGPDFFGRILVSWNWIWWSKFMQWSATTTTWTTSFHSKKKFTPKNYNLIHIHQHNRDIIKPIYHTFITLHQSDWSLRCSKKRQASDAIRERRSPLPLSTCILCVACRVSLINTLCFNCHSQRWKTARFLCI